MRRSICVASTPSLREKYKRLVTSDWKRGALDDVLDLLWKELEEPDARLPFFGVLDPRRNVVAGSGFNTEVIEEIRSFRKHFHGSDVVPPVPEEFPNRKTGRSRTQAETVWTYLILQNLAHIRGETGFFANTQSLLFLLAIDFLLPALEAPADLAVKDCLINALYMHTFVTWTHDPQRQAHYFFLQADLMDYLRQPELRRDNLLYSLNLTPLEDHSFLTKVQAYVFSLTDDHKEEEAKRFLRKLYRRVPEMYLSELEEILNDVQGHAVSRT